MLERHAALRLAFVALLTLPSASRSLAAAPEPQDVKSPPVRVLQTAPARTAQMQVCLREVPDLSRYNTGSVGAILAKVDLVFGSTRPQKSTAPKGTIVGQSEKPGTQVRCGTRIDVYVSDGTPVLQQTGPGPADVWRKLPSTSDGVPPSSTSDGPPANSGSNSRRPTPPDRPLPGGDGQPPQPDLCPVPSVMNHPYLEVRERLRGWSIGRVEKVETRAAQEGTILKQSPAPRTMVKCGSSIDIAVAVAPPIDPVPPVNECSVPSLTNYPIVDVRERLRGWTIGKVEKVETRAAREGTILKQSPAARSLVKCNSSIDIAVAVMPPDQPQVTECPAPSLTNYSVVEVRERLRGWTIGRVQKVETRAAQEGTILQQSPAPRTMVKCGSAIDIAVAVAPFDSAQGRPEHGRGAPPIVAPPPPCVVPGIESGDVASARLALARRNLVLGTVNTRPSEKSPGTVIGQNPAPESTIACGSAIDVWIAVPLPLVRVPVLQGQDAATAARTLEGVGLVLGTADRRESELAAGGVVEQLPAPNTEVRRGTPVNVWLSSGLPLTPIPDVRGRDRGAAAEILRSLHFRLGEVLERAIDATPGTIVDQQPPAGTLSRRDTPVRVWVSASIEVPSVIGRREADATAILTNQRLRVGAVSTRESAEPAGTVIDQQPQPRRPVRLNAPVDLVLAIPVTVLIPDLRGRDRQAAISLVTSARLQLGETTTREADEPAGMVIEQSPRAGERVEIGTAVQVSVAAPIRVEVPSLVGKQEGEALALLKNRRLKVGQVQTREAAGTRGAILDQRPRAGERVDAGSAIDLTVAGAVTIVVPDLRGTTRDDSGNLLRLRGLVPGSVETRVSAGFPGSIVEQQPAAGARVEAGTPVAIWIAAPAPPELIPPQVTTFLEVPDLKGRTRDQALAILADRGLVLGQAGTILSTSTPDTVVSQQPAGASRVLPGTSVDVVLASPPSPTPDAGGVIPPPVARPWNLPMPLVWLLLGVGLGAASAGITVKAKTRATREPRDVPPSIAFAPHPDPDMRVELSADGPFTRSELWLRPGHDAGSQTIQGSGPLGMVEVMEAR